MSLLKEGQRSHLERGRRRAFARSLIPSVCAVEGASRCRSGLEKRTACIPAVREVIRLKFQSGFSYREISRISGHSVSNVGFLIHTGLKTIRRRMADVHPIRVQA